MKITSAYANKIIKKLGEDKEFWRKKEEQGCTYVAAIDEEPVIPEYDYGEVSQKIAGIDDRILKLKHAINLANCTNEIEVRGTKMTVDMILIKMAQMNKRKAILDDMRKHEPKERVTHGMHPPKLSVPEYRYINYDLQQATNDYESTSMQIVELQIALDKYNQTVEFEADI